MRELLNAIAPLTEAELRAVVSNRAAALLPDGIEPIPRLAGSGARRALQGMRSVPDADIVHGLDVDLPFRSSCPTVATVHDLSVFDVPWAFSRYRAAGERRLVAAAIGRADALVAVSAFTAERINHHFGRSACVIPLAPRSSPAQTTPEARGDVRRRYDLPDRFVLQLASIEPRKDVDLLASACTAVGVPLVLAGSIGRRTVPAGARHLGYVPSADIDPLLDTADIVAYISLYEGFGLPPLDAMSRGRPVVASAVGALPEIAADGAELVPPGNEEALKTALRELLADDDRRADLATRAVNTASRLSWRATAVHTLDVYRRLGATV
ncbi:MAG: glycosyltransferase family 1 protein [Actinomycetota bacterium]